MKEPATFRQLAIIEKNLASGSLLSFQLRMLHRDSDVSYLAGSLKPHLKRRRTEARR